MSPLCGGTVASDVIIIKLCQLWEDYRQRRKRVKVVVPKEKRENRKITLQRIKEQGGPSW